MGMQGRWETGWSNQHNISVRKCPPHEPTYKAKSYEFICELEDYSDEDIQMYMQTQIGDASKDETHMFEQAFNGMTNYLLTGKREEDG
ncbi:uncharacterized protein METZ01_LOCUS254670 [marine metagenome]|uniref:Uncharacterized protein n=1 Tax=marine metagenome TaxID=408172 RepID=A0A382IQC2_9ZZZZ